MKIIILWCALKKDIYGTLVEKDIVIADEKRIAELLQKHFVNFTKSMKLKALIIDTTNNIQPLTKTCENLISVREKRETCHKITADSFHVNPVPLDNVKQRSLQPKFENVFRI